MSPNDRQNTGNDNNEGQTPETAMSEQMQLIQMMFEQQRITMESLIRASVSAPTAMHDAFHILPDLTKNIETFNGEVKEGNAKRWLRDMNTMALLHRWPESIKLETARTHLIGAAGAWFQSRRESIHTWQDFETKFQRTFVSETSLPERWRNMEQRVQKQGESTQTYFHEKMKLCIELNLSFKDSKEQIAVGLRSKDLCSQLLSKSHQDEDELLADVRMFERVDTARRERIVDGIGGKKDSSAKRDAGNKSKASSAPSQSTAAGTKVLLTPKTEPSPTGEKPSGELKCFSCNTSGHLSRDCPNPRCYNCNESGHLSKDCPKPKIPIKCKNCNGEGHSQKNCPNKEKSKVNLMINQGGQESSVIKFIKTARINNREFQSMIDPGSSVCLIQASAAIRAGVVIEPHHEELYGLGDMEIPSTKAIGKASVVIEIDGVQGKEVDLLIVPDKSQPVEIIVGRTWTEQQHIAYVRVGDTLKIGRCEESPFNQIDPTEKTRVELRAADDTILLARSVNFLRARADRAVTGGITIEPRDDSYGQLLNVQEGEVQVAVCNTREKEHVIRAGEIVARADLTDPEEREEEETDVEERREIRREDVNVDPATTEEEETALFNLLTEYRDCFAQSTREIGCTQVTKMSIEEVEGSKPVQQKPYRTNQKDREAMRQVVAEWKKDGIVTETRSPYASPALIVWKKSGEPRMVVDFRRLNQQTIKQSYPLPTIDDQLEQLSGARLFTVLDLAHGFLQIPLTEESKPKTAFVTPDESGQFERMVFGLSNAPYEFARLMDVALGPLRNKIAFCYMDDILIPAKSWEEMRARLREVFEALRAANLTLRLKKCNFGQQEVEYLGFRISRNGVRPGVKKIEAIEAFPRPENVHEVRRFLGLTSFFRRFVMRHAVRAEPLTRLTKKNVEFQWSTEQEKAFNDLRQALTAAPVLRLYDPKARTEVHTDASKEGIAGMLMQADEGEEMKLVYCVSKKTSETERNYHSSRLELMAIVWSLDRLRQFLLGIPFTVFTDCQALVYLNTMKTGNPQIARWANLIQDYDVTIKHRSGDKMAHADALSRSPIEAGEDTMDQVIEGRLEVFVTLSVEDQVAMMQKSNSELEEKIRILSMKEEDKSTEQRNHTRDLEMRNGILFKKMDIGGEQRLLFVVPKPMRKSTVIKHHDLMGHFGVERTVSKILEQFWFPGLRRYVRQHVNMCLECLIHKQPAGRKPGLLHPIPPGRRPFETIHMDHLGPFVPSTRKNRELLVIIDNLTRYVSLYPMRDTKTRSVLKAVEDLVAKRGLPATIISDRGTCFTSRGFEEFCKEHGVKHVLNSARHPQANGMVERVNRTLLPILAISITRQDRRDWDQHVKRIERDLNNMANKTTGKTPFEVLHGYRPQYQDGALRGITDREEQRIWEEPEKIQREVIERIEEEQGKYKAAYDQKHFKGPEYEVGEIVFMRKAPEQTGEPTKLQPRYRGPLVVTEKLPGDTYRVADLRQTAGRVYASTAHVSQMKGWRCPLEEEEIGEAETEEKFRETETEEDIEETETEEKTEEKTEEAETEEKIEETETEEKTEEKTEEAETEEKIGEAETEEKIGETETERKIGGTETEEEIGEAETKEKNGAAETEEMTGEAETEEEIGGAETKEASRDETGRPKRSRQMPVRLRDYHLTRGGQTNQEGPDVRNNGASPGGSSSRGRRKKGDRVEMGGRT